MNQKRGFFAILVLLALGGVILAIARHVDTGTPFLPGQEKSVWLVEARIDFDADGGAVTASLALPEDQLPGYQLVAEQAASPGYGFAILTERRSRRAEWTRREASGEQSLYYSAQLVESENRDDNHANDPPVDRSRIVYWDEARELAARDLLKVARERSSSPQSLTRELIKLLDSAASQNAALLRSGAEQRSDLLMHLLERADIATRSVKGLYLEDARRRQTLSRLVEFYTGSEWLLVDPRTGAVGLPADFLVWTRGRASVLDVIGGAKSRVQFSMIRQTIPATQLARASTGEGLFSRLGVQRLPIEEQSMFKLLLLLPLGAAVVVFMRVIIGLQTSGTFMPVLIALAFLQTSLVAGLVSFVLIVAAGLALRSYLSRLNLLLVARIATLIVLVVFLISAFSIIGYQLGFSTGMTITFFPMIIIAWTIERMSILWEEDGSSEVIKQGGGSLLVAVFAYLLMENPLLVHLSFNFPELNLVLLASILAMGQYTGYKLSELWRFRAMDDL
ncbi:MAG: inactive transglutaminase family protein [Halieaceae bacterium]|nr:inactive transglutaminase family protein [Halieaceae bacterium]